MYICVYVCMCLDMYVYLYVYLNPWIHMYVSICMYVYLDVDVCIYMYMCLAFSYIYTHHMNIWHTVRDRQELMRQPKTLPFHTLIQSKNKIPDQPAKVTKTKQAPNRTKQQHQGQQQKLKREV